MKKSFLPRLLLMAFLTITALQFPKNTSAQVAVGVSYQTFYDDLGPYGQWVNDPNYGYVWQPSVGGDFRPYSSGGHWEMTTYGNMWVSDYPWGWAPFHYGRWVYDDFYGWEWIPGTTWGPAWVCWRHGGGYYGWAPLGPGAYADITLYHAPDPWWVFCPEGHFLENGYHDYYYGDRATPIIRNTVIINNTYVNHGVTYYMGPKREEVQTVAHRPVTVYNVNRSAARGGGAVSGNSINVYGPHVVRSTNTAAKPAPAKVVNSTHPISNNAFIKENNVKLPRNTGVNGGHLATPSNTNKASIAPRTNPNPATINHPQPKANPRPQAPAPKQNVAPRQNMNRPAPAPRQNAAPPKQNMNQPAPAPRQNAAPPRQNMNRPAPSPRQAPPPQHQNMNRPAPAPRQPAPHNNPPPRQAEPPRPQPQPQMERPKEEEHPK